MLEVMLEIQCRRLTFLKGNELKHFWLRLYSVKNVDPKKPKDLEKSDIEQFQKDFGGNSMFQAFGSKKSQFLELHRYSLLTATPQRMREWKEHVVRNFDIFTQRFITERHETLGSDLATAHFVVYRGGKVKFHNHSNWIGKNEDEYICEELPTKYVRDMSLECIDVSNTKIRYEGLENFINLKKLKWLSFKNCLYVDDWFLDKISGEFAETLEYLDISDCINVTENGLNGFYRFQNLKKLVVHNIVKNISFEYRCFLLEDTIPGLVIEGVKYIDVK